MSTPDGAETQDNAGTLAAPVQPGTKPICKKCRQPCTTTVVTALGQTWHPEHFNCTHCRKPITEATFKEHENQPYCLNDFIRLFAKRCYGCNEMIVDAVLNAMGQSWHYECFQCARCKNPIGMSEFFRKGGLPICLACQSQRKSTGMSFKKEKKK